MSKDRHDRKVDLTVDRSGDTFQRIEVISGVGRRRDWSDEFKARLVAESLEDGVMISEVARRHGVPPQRLYAWRNQMRTQSGQAEPTSTEFASVAVAAVAPPVPRAHSASPASADLIEIVIGTTVIRVRAAISESLLMAVARVAKALS